MRKVLFFSIFFVVFSTSIHSDDRYQNAVNEYRSRYSFHVVRNRFFEKKFRPELSIYSHILMNRSFIYSVFWNLELGYHLAEFLGLFLEGSRASTINRSSCEMLGNLFLIEPIVEETRGYLGVGLTFTPTYGKYLLSNEYVVYSDILIKVSGGILSQRARMSSCVPGTQNNEEPSWTPYLSSGLWQRFFLDRSLSLNWGGGAHWYIKPAQEGEDSQERAFSLDQVISNIFLSIGLSYFF